MFGHVKPSFRMRFGDSRARRSALARCVSEWHYQLLTRSHILSATRNTGESL